MPVRDIYLIPETVPCPHCEHRFDPKPALYLLNMYAWIYCSVCDGRITKQDIGKYLAVIKNVGEPT